MKHRNALLSPFIYSLFLLLFVISGAAPAAEIITSPNDHRAYASFELENTLRVVLISDPDTDKAAASLVVNTGHFQDPHDRLGLAHFLEHMLFLGTRQYPDANAYREFIVSHGGHDNAFTSQETTNYFFDIDKNSLDEALDRFAQFFIAPLFDKAFVKREMNAVDSEYKLKIKDDNRRILQIMRATSNPAHPFSKFSVGNLQTLSDQPGSATRDRLIDFYQEHYSANLMTLAVLGSESLAELEKMVIPRFSKIRNQDIPRLNVKAPLFRQTQRGVRIDIVPLMKQQQLTLSFPLPWRESFYIEKPTLLLSSLLGDESKGSLFANLKKRGWANSLSAGQGIVANNAMTFDIDIDLTETGLGHVDEITELSFQYIELIRRQGLKAWRLDEMRRLNELAFRFREKAPASSEVMMLADNLLHFPTEMIIKGSYAIPEFDAAQINNLLRRLTPDNMRMIVIAKGLATDRVEPLYDTPYRITPLSPKSIRAWSRPARNTVLALPEKNPFIPEHIAIKNSTVHTVIPQRLIDEPGMRVWHKEDEEFHIPKADLFISLGTPDMADTIRNNVLATIYTALVEDHLNEETYPARLAGLDYSVSGSSNGIGFSVHGYDDKQNILIDRILDTIMNLDIDPRRFQIKKEKIIESWHNSRLQRPYQQTNRELGILLHPLRWQDEDNIAALDPLTADDVGRYQADLWKTLYLGMMAHGNITAEETRQLAQRIAGRLFTRARKGQRQPVQAELLTPGQDISRRLDIDHNDSSITIYYQGNDDSIDSQARNALLAQLIDAPFFNTLRTEQQLGYVVYAGQADLFRIPGISFTVQSPVAGADQLLQHIESFIAGLDHYLATLSESEFEQHKQGLRALLLKKDERLGERTQSYRQDLRLHYFSFDHRERLAEHITRLTRDEVIAYCRSLLASDRKRRLVIYNIGHSHPDSKPLKISTIKNIEDFKKSQPLYTLPEE